MKFALRDPYQIEAVRKTFALFDGGVPSGVVSIGTAGGKTIVGSAIIEEALRRGWKVVWAVHTRELTDAAMDSIRLYNDLDEFSIGVERAEWRVPVGAKVVVGSVQTLNQPKRFAELRKWFSPTLLVFDEGHRAEAVTYRRIAKELGVFDGDCYCLLLTATPYRSDKVNIYCEDEDGGAVTIRDRVTKHQRPATYEDTIVQRLICNYDYQYLLHNAWVVDAYHVPMRTVTDISDVPMGANGEFVQEKLKVKISHDSRTEPVIADWYASYSDMPTMCFCADVDHAHRTAAIARNMGADAVALDGMTDDYLRTKEWKRFQAGDTQMLCVRGLLIEGADAWRCRCVLQICPIGNYLPYVQKCGRSLRPEPGTVDGTTSVEERLLNIAASSKPCAYIITVVDKDKHPNRTMQAPNLIGLPSDIDMQGLSMREALEQTIEYDGERRERAVAAQPETIAKFKAMLARDERKARAASKPKPDWRYKSAEGTWVYSPLSKDGYSVEVHGTGETREVYVSYKGAELKRVQFNGVTEQSHVQKVFKSVQEGVPAIISKHKASLPRGTVNSLSSRQLFILRCAGYSDLSLIDTWPLGKATGIIARQSKMYARAKAAEERDDNCEQTPIKA